MALLPEGLDELPAACLSPCGPPNLAELYSETQRLALEELVAGGPDAFAAFLRQERLGRFLNPDEVRSILRTAERPREEGAAAEDEDSFDSSHDCSSGTYFPEQSDLEPPLLELGWPAFYRGAYRGATRVEAHFQPRGAGAGGPYGCKDALRQQLRSAREVSGPDRRPSSGMENGGLGSAGPHPVYHPSNSSSPGPSSWLGIVGGVSVAQNRIVPEFQLLIFTSPGKGDQKYLHFQIVVKPNQMANFPALDPTFRGFLGVALPREKFLKDGPRDNCGPLGIYYC